jgi:hypothetical protein
MKRFLLIASLLSISAAAFAQQVVTTVAVKHPLFGVQQFPSLAAAENFVFFYNKVLPKPPGCGTACEAVWQQLTEYGVGVHVVDDSPMFLITVSYRTSTDSPDRKQIVESSPRTGPVTSRILWIGKALDVSVLVVPHVSTGKELTASLK